MKSIKRAATILSLAVLAAALPALAQYGQEPGPGGPPKGHREGGPGHVSPKEKAAHLAKKLNLTDEQKSKVEAIFQDEHDQLVKLRENSSLSREERHAKIEEIWKSASNRIKEVLTKEQQRKYEEIQEHRQKRHEHPNKPGE
jgi:Spy/CpxP family protein refolding chaperone